MWIETSNEVYAVVFVRHKRDLTVHASFTDVDGNGLPFSSGKPEILTEWGFKNAETPLLKIVETKDDKDQKEWDAKFYIYCG